MSLQFYNSLTRRKKIFTPLKNKLARIYHCGPTVYAPAHLGNFRTFLLADFLRRTLEYSGFKVRQVMNITDVGHLTSDEDTGEDKVEQAARKQRKSAWEISRHYTVLFLQDLQRLNILKPHFLPRATDHIKEQIELVQVLEKKGFSYRLKDGLYFDTQKLPSYKKFIPQKLQEQKAGARIATVPGKHHPSDFALWKFSPQKPKRQMEWESPWGTGFPGWHLECAVMATKYLGLPFDIHTGGMDHMGTHHPNEMALIQAAFGKKMARFWIHGVFLTIKEQRMGKSEGNLIVLQDLIKKGYNPLAFRLLTLTAHYRHPLSFTWQALDQAQKNLEKIQAFVIKLQNTQTRKKTACFEKNLKNLQKKFRTALEDDLNLPQALAAFWELIRKINPLLEKGVLTAQQAQAVSGVIWDFNKVLGILRPEDIKPLPIPSKIKKLIEQREKLRQEKKWALADQIRKQLINLGYQLEDTKKGPRIIKTK